MAAMLLLPKVNVVLQHLLQSNLGCMLYMARSIHNITTTLFYNPNYNVVFTTLPQHCGTAHMVYRTSIK